MQHVTVKNTGRVAAEVSVLVSASTIDIQDCFELCQCGNGPYPSNRLFSGLITIEPNECITMGV